MYSDRMPEVYDVHIAAILTSDLDHSFRSTVKFNLNSTHLGTIPSDLLLSACCSKLRTHLNMQRVLMFAFSSRSNTFPKSKQYMHGTLLNCLCNVFILKGNVFSLSWHSCLMTEMKKIFCRWSSDLSKIIQFATVKTRTQYSFADAHSRAGMDQTINADAICHLG